MNIAGDLLENDGKKFLEIMGKLSGGTGALGIADRIGETASAFKDDLDDDLMDSDDSLEIISQGHHESRMEESRQFFHMHATNSLEKRLLEAYEKRVLLDLYLEEEKGKKRREKKLRKRQQKPKKSSQPKADPGKKYANSDDSQEESSEEDEKTAVEVVLPPAPATAVVPSVKKQAKAPQQPQPQPQPLVKQPPSQKLAVEPPKTAKTPSAKQPSPPAATALTSPAKASPQKIVVPQVVAKAQPPRPSPAVSIATPPQSPAKPQKSSTQPASPAKPPAASQPAQGPRVPAPQPAPAPKMNPWARPPLPTPAPPSPAVIPSRTQPEALLLPPAVSGHSVPSFLPALPSTAYRPPVPEFSFGGQFSTDPVQYAPALAQPQQVQMSPVWAFPRTPAAPLPHPQTLNGGNLPHDLFDDDDLPHIPLPHYGRDLRDLVGDDDDEEERGSRLPSFLGGRPPPRNQQPVGTMPATSQSPSLFSANPFFPGEPPFLFNSLESRCR